MSENLFSALKDTKNTYFINSSLEGSEHSFKSFRNENQSDTSQRINLFINF